MSPIDFTSALRLFWICSSFEEELLRVYRERAFEVYPSRKPFRSDVLRVLRYIFLMFHCHNDVARVAINARALGTQYIYVACFWYACFWYVFMHVFSTRLVALPRCAQQGVLYREATHCWNGYLWNDVITILQSSFIRGRRISLSVWVEPSMS